MNATFETARQIHQIGGGRVIIGSGSLVGAASLMAVPSVLQWHQLTDRQPSLCMYVYIYIYVCVCVCVCVCLCVCVRMYVFIIFPNVLYAHRSGTRPTGGGPSTMTPFHQILQRNTALSPHVK